MKSFIGCICACLLLLVSATPGYTTETEFSSDEILKRLEDALQMSSEKLSELQPEIDARSEELKQLIDEAMEKGFVRMDEMNKKLDEISKQTEQKVDELLTSEQYLKLKTVLGNIDKEALEEAKTRIVAELTALLELTEQQIAELKPVFDESVENLNLLLDDLAKEGVGSWQKFSEQYEQLTTELRKQLESVLNGEQLEKLEIYNQKKKDAIQKELMEV